MNSFQRGQSFEPFKMLIGVIMAATVLVIILGAVNYFEGLRFDVSQQRFYDGLNTAVKQPSGETLVISDLQFRKDDTFTSGALAKNMGLESGCVEITEPASGAFRHSNGSISFNQHLFANVLIKCNAGERRGCEISCEVTFQET